MRTNYKKLIALLLSAALSASFITAFADEVSSATTSDKVVSDTTDNDTYDDITDEDIVVTVDKKVLTKDVDYVLSYENNVNVGVAKVVVLFIGNYSGELEREFSIIKKSAGGGGGGGGGSSATTSTTVVSIVDKDGNTVAASKVVKNNTVTITLPSGKTIDEDNYYTVTVTDKNGNPNENFAVTVKDKSGNSETGATDANGKVVLPAQTAATQPPVSETPVPDVETHTAYINGYPEGDFRPDGNITRAETAAMLSRVMTFETSDIDIAFSDVSSEIWYADSVIAMSSAGMIIGYPDGTFKPENQITRAEFVAMLMRNQEMEEYRTLEFSDVNSDMWSADYIYSAYKAGYISGYPDGSFKPDAPITRAEAVKIINLVLGRDDFSNENNPFSDVEDTHWAREHILEAAVTHNTK